MTQTLAGGSRRRASRLGLVRARGDPPRVDPGRRPRRGNDRGAAAVEFALVVPILLMILFAIITFGFLLAQELAIENAARQAARYGAVENRTCDEVIAEATSAAQPLVDLATGTIAVTRGPAGSGGSPCSGEPCKGSADKDNVKVTITYPGEVLIPLWPGMGDTVTLTAEGVFRCEWF